MANLTTWLNGEIALFKTLLGNLIQIKHFINRLFNLKNIGFRNILQQKKRLIIKIIIRTYNLIKKILRMNNKKK
jgi:hypothetical protein